MTPFRNAETPADAEVIRRIRNAGRAWFENTQYITAEHQQTWWQVTSRWPSSEFVCLLVGTPTQGYGMLLRRDERFWVSLAVDPSAQGRGFGTAIYAELAKRGECYAAVHQDNAPSLRAAKLAGYEVDDQVPAPVASNVQQWIVLRGPVT